MRWLPVGDRALLVDLGDDPVLPAYHRIRRLAAAGTLPTPTDIVPAARTILVDGVHPTTWWEAYAPLGDEGDADGDRSQETENQTVIVAVRYDGADLDEVARQWGCSVEDVVRRHQDAEFTVAFCGFAPGFAYAESAPALPVVSRRDDPRTEVAAGSVGLAGPYCGIYPVAMPGGWQLIGRTDEVMFDVDRARPATLEPGDQVRFRAVEDRP